MIYRKKYIDLFRTFLEENRGSLIVIVGEKSIGKSLFIHECEENGIFGTTGTYQHIKAKGNLPIEGVHIKDKAHTLIIDTDSFSDFSLIRTFIDSLSSEIQIILTWEGTIDDDTSSMFTLPGVGLREYLEHCGVSVSIDGLISGDLDISLLNSYRDAYLMRGSFPTHLLSPEHIRPDFDKKRAIINQELYEKEYDIFSSYLRTLAMNVGNLFKADQLAKLLGISRRKVNKYTEILLKHGIIVSLFPWGENTETETSRHTKLYFSDLSYMKAILSDMHAEGTLRQGALENMVYLELSRKLGATHTISFYRKKSGAQISFLLSDNTTNLLTPVEVTLRSTEAVPQVFRIFDEEYGDQVERYMLINDTLASIGEISGKGYMVIPYVGI